MAVYERTYKRYTGRQTPQWTRFLILPRFAFRDVFRSKLLVGFLVSSVHAGTVAAALRALDLDGHNRPL